MGKPSAPPPPDYAAAAKEQGAANVQAAQATNYLNQANQVGPNGSLTYSYDPKQGHTLADGTFIPQTTATTTLSPQQQALADQNNTISQALNSQAIKGIGYVADATNTPTTAGQFKPLQYGAGNVGNVQGGIDMSGVSAAPKSSDFAAQGQQVTDALMSRMQPQMDRQRSQLNTQLSNQGIFTGSEANKNAQDDLNRGENDQRTSAFLAGSQEQQRLFDNSNALHNQSFAQAQNQGTFGNQAQQQGYNQGLASGQFNNQAQQLAIQQADYFKNQPLNMLNALRSGNQVNSPTFGNVAAGAQIAAAPVYAAANDGYNAQLQAYNSQQSTFGSLLGGLGALGGAAITKSDRRLKENIVEIGKTITGLGIYTFNYIGKIVPQLGYMADEVIKLYPKAVSIADDGFMQVDYRMVK